MARIRSITPAFRTNETVARWPIEVRYFYVLLWGYCDDYGRGRDNARLILADTLPLDDSVTPSTVSEWMDTLERDEVIRRYQVAGVSYFDIPSWPTMQKPQYPSKSDIPAFPDDPLEDLQSPSRDLLEGVLSVSRDSLRGGGEVVVGGGGEPPRYCPRHLPDGTSSPCGPCGDARKNHDRWTSEHERWKRSPEGRMQATLALSTDCPAHLGYPTTDRGGCAACARERENALEASA